MVERLLVATDGSEPAAAALEHAATVAAESGATAHVLHVAEDDGVADEIVAEGESWFESADATAVGEVRSGEPAETIRDYAAEIDADAVVVGTHGREGIERLLLGSVAEAVVREAPAPVLVVPPGAGDHDYPYRTIVAATDGSEHAESAIRRAVDLTLGSVATVHLLSVVDVAPIGLDERTDVRVDLFEGAARELVADGAAVARSAGAANAETAVRIGRPHEEIHAYADEVDADLVAIGSHGRSGVDRLLLGSVSERVLRTASTPVLAVGDADQ